MAWTYYGGIYVGNTNGAYTMLPMSYPVSNNPLLTDNYYITSTGLDTRMTLNGADKERMLADDRILWVSSLAAQSSNSFHYEFGNASSVNMPIIVGNNGYITRLDDAALEGDNSYKIDLNGYIDTSSVVANKNLLNKNGSIRIYVSNPDEVSVLLSSATAGNGTYNATSSSAYSYKNNAVYNTAWTSATDTGRTANSTIIVGQAGGGSYTVYRGALYFDTSAIPDGATITSATLKIACNADASDTDFNITITNGQPTYPHDPFVTGDYAKANYADTSGGSLTTSGITLDAYKDIAVNATGLTWINLTGTTKLLLRSSRDISGTSPGGFEDVLLYGADNANYKPKLVVNWTTAASTTLVGTFTAGEHDLSVVSNATTVKLYDGANELDSEAAVSLTDVADDWIINQNNAMPYIDEISYYKPYTTLLYHYHPVAMIHNTLDITGTATFTTASATITGSGTDWTTTLIGSRIKSNTDGIEYIITAVASTTSLTIASNYVETGGAGHAFTVTTPYLLDTEGAAQNSVITFGSNPTGLTVIGGGMVSAGGIPAITSAPISTGAPVIPAGVGSLSGDTGQRLANSPLYPLFDAINTAAQGDMPIGVQATGIAVLITMGFVIFAMRIPNVHILLVAGAGGLGLALSYMLGLYSAMWIPSIYTVAVIAVLILERKPQF